MAYFAGLDVSVKETNVCILRITSVISRTPMPRRAMGRPDDPPQQVCPRGHIAKCSHLLCQNFPRR
jgi:hypothetical protein